MSFSNPISTHYFDAHFNSVHIHYDKYIKHWDLASKHISLLKRGQTIELTTIRKLVDKDLENTQYPGILDIQTGHLTLTLIVVFVLATTAVVFIVIRHYRHNVAVPAEQPSLHTIAVQYPRVGLFFLRICINIIPRFLLLLTI